MLRYLRLMPVIALASGFAPVAILYASQHLTWLRAGEDTEFYSTEFIRHLVVAIVATLAVTGLVTYYVRRLSPSLEGISDGQDNWLASLSLAKITGVIVLSAGLSLFLELALIRWQISIYPALAFYKNFSLLACFAGIGLGYALSGQRTVPMVVVVPLLLWQVLAQGVLVYGLNDSQGVSLHASPITEQLDIGLTSARTNVQVMAIYVVLASLFLQTAACLIPIGQLCGKAMARTTNLHAYGLNLVGSVGGTLLMLAMGHFWTGPVVWFALVFASVFLLIGAGTRGVRTTAVAGLVMLALFAWPREVGVQSIHSPYQLIERVTREDGLMTVRVAGRFYQRVYDLRPEHVAHMNSDWMATEMAYYDLPYALAGSPQDVVVVGAGSGNDVAAALRADAAHVDAVEIDPVIVALGHENHPERPYDNPKVTPIVNDARSHFRATEHSYDLIIYGLLDSHSALSHASSVRVDSFVYTIEGFAEARSRLKENGLICLSFVNLGNSVIGRKIDGMLTEAFDGTPPLALYSAESDRYMFLHGNGRQTIDPAVYETAGFVDVSDTMAADTTPLDLSTDDWPFFYMPVRVYPFSYLGMIAAVALMTLMMTAILLPGKPRRGHLSYFLLGAGFMLVEAKAITELGLVFGNTWMVIGFVICGVLIMSLAANICVALWRPATLWIPALLLVLSILLGYGVAAQWGFQSDSTGKIVAITLLTLPMLFSGVLFAGLLRTDTNVAGGLAANVFGAMCGGLLEYNAMKFGYQSLYLLAILVYGLAFLSMYRKTGTTPVAILD